MIFGDNASDPRPQQYLALSAQVQAAQREIDDAYSSWHAGLFTLLTPGATQSVQDMVTSSDALAESLVSALQNLAQNPDATAEDGTPQSKNLPPIAASYVGRANSIISTIGSQNVTSETISFIQGLPQALQTAISWTTNQAGKVVTSTAWSLTKTVLILGGGAALVLFLLKKSGAKISAPFVSI